MTTLYRTILFAALACYGWYYNTSLNVGNFSKGAPVHLDSARSASHGGE
ncbi:hypothetical protein [Paraburkholderia humisilvae]|uniref:Uncharacterized protein n=1 Tax=Paraburkholderia humisilvae TaxID=627669 RepID=A0A6J5EQN3_9BURK|nr:hypothetical protein [Paraburkholderia humisilvae]CAB3767542.1 hypothetical protein LMG29542_05641 [Paraburkholderia humisilvae]